MILSLLFIGWMKAADQVIREIAFTRISKVGSILGRALLAHFGDIESIFTEKKRNLIRVSGIGDEIANQILNASQLIEEAEKDYHLDVKKGIKHVFLLDENYPKRLRQIPDAPLLLYHRGNFSLHPERTVAIIGTRTPTNKGKETTENLLNVLKDTGITVISGLAYGIDITAHRYCVRENISTIGIMGNGMGRIYPMSHIQIAREMEKNGGLISEFSYNTPPDAVNFPMRNRIVAGMSDVVVVVESGKKGGSMITASLANDYDREVCAFPGRAGDPSTAGCNHLIKKQMAHLIESGNDLLELMNWDQKTLEKPRQIDLFSIFTESEHKIYSMISEGKEKDIDTLAFESKISHGELAAILLQLECKGHIKTLPGKKFQALG